MAFAVTPTAFIPQRPDQIRNGTVASANLIETVRHNQLWLGTQDCSFSNFYVQPKHVAGPIEIIQAFRIPPFCSYVEFWFWAAGTFNGADTAPPFILATSLDTSDEVLLNMIPSGSDTTLKPSVMREDEAGWVSMRGLPTDLTTPTPGVRALRVADLDSSWSEWRDIRIKIETSGENVQIYTAAIRTVPAKGLVGENPVIPDVEPERHYLQFDGVQDFAYVENAIDLPTPDEYNLLVKLVEYPVPNPIFPPTTFTGTLLNLIDPVDPAGLAPYSDVFAWQADYLRIAGYVSPGGAANYATNNFPGYAPSGVQVISHFHHKVSNIVGIVVAAGGAVQWASNVAAVDSAPRHIAIGANVTAALAFASAPSPIRFVSAVLLAGSGGGVIATHPEVEQYSDSAPGPGHTPAETDALDIWPGVVGYWVASDIVYDFGGGQWIIPNRVSGGPNMVLSGPTSGDLSLFYP